MEQLPELQDQKILLVVDDDPDILNFISKALEANYRILRANSGQEALEKSSDCHSEIHLLLSDFQMSGMTGVELATKITAHRPTIKVLLMSGFTGGMLVLNEGWHFLPKPFITSQLRALIAGLVSPDKPSTFAAST
jgi:two-component system, cell cycle sensor histidine kinase and response regulator CckA